MLKACLLLFWSFFKVGLVAFGGGQVFIPLLERELVTTTGLLNSSEFARMLGIVQMSPGAISIKIATYAGYKVAGVPGVVAANLGNLTPSVLAVIILFYAYGYLKKHHMEGALRAIEYAVWAMLIVVVAKMIDPHRLRDPLALALFVGAGVALYFGLNPVVVIPAAAIFGVVFDL